jgi:DeoR/GlpR family transcriptional regulator of sugar metabolism
VDLFANERHSKIYELIKTNGAVTTNELIKKFGVSIETVRRDLLSMEKDGKLNRVHGGAVVKGEMKPFLDLSSRNKEFEKEKALLSFKATEFIKNGDIIAIDTGSTAIIFASVLKETFDTLTIITHSLDVFNILAYHKNFSVILTGGEFLRTENAFYGHLAIKTIKNLNIQKSFIFPSAVSLKGGICDYEKNLFGVQEYMLKSADEVYILADSSKFEKKALLKVSDTSQNYIYITDDKISNEILDLYKDNNSSINTGGNRG